MRHRFSLLRLCVLAGLVSALAAGASPGGSQPDAETHPAAVAGAWTNFLRDASDPSPRLQQVSRPENVAHTTAAGAGAKLNGDIGPGQPGELTVLLPPRAGDAARAAAHGGSPATDCSQRNAPLRV